ncbi:MAG: hypothetical protein RG741_01060 [Bacteroidales bacterium]|nr:hypothetical protein [Bacteroidales bacterium]
MALPLAVILLILLHAHLTLYNPPPQKILHQEVDAVLTNHTDTFGLMTWNLGYAGLGDDMDFFYDGGRQVRTSRERTMENLSAIGQFIQSHQRLDFFLFQEADQGSRRSYRIHMPDSISRVLPDAHLAFGKNYDVRFVPVPWYAPMGRVLSGVLTASHPKPSEVVRYSYPGSYPYPGSLFNLQRCLLLSRYPLTNGKELVLINTHNSAFDDGDLRKKQMDFLKNLLLDEFEKGNYVIAGGDFNQCPPAFKSQFSANVFNDEKVMYIPGDFLEDWHFVYDPAVPTNRRVVAPYDAETTKTTLIDFFIMSPNIKPLSVKGVHLGFRHSDHNPVLSEFVLL